MRKISLISTALLLVINFNFVSQVKADPTHPPILYAGSNYNNGINKSGDIKGNFTSLVFPSDMRNYNHIYSGSTFSGTDAYITAYIYDGSKSSMTYSGKVLKSTDGINYKKVAGNTYPLVAVASDNNGTVVAVGGMQYPGTEHYWSVIMTSKDNGETFTTAHLSSLDVTDLNDNPPKFGGAMTKVFYLNNTFFTLGKAGTNLYMLTSEDGLNWQQVGSPVAGFISGHDVSPVGMAYSNGKYVIALTDGNDGYSWDWIATSSDGVNWKVTKKQVSTIYDNFASLIVRNGEFIIYGNDGFDDKGFILTSADGETWNSQQATNKRVFNVEFDSNSNLYVGTYGNSLRYSLDGISWDNLRVVSDNIRTLSLGK